MTAAQLAHLAELAAFAADFFASTDPAAARKFGEASLRADALSVELRRAEDRARHRPAVTRLVALSEPPL
jgi:hypothetical protein